MNPKTAAHVMTIACALTASAATAVAQQAVVGAKKTPARPSVQGFNVVLVMGDLAASAAAPDNVPAAARKALADMKDFLPYKGYRLLDTSWILSDNSSAHATSRLRGLEDRDYQISLEVVPEAAAGSTLRVSFSLSEPGRPNWAAPHPTDGGQRSGAAGRSESGTPSIDHLREEMARRAAELARRQAEAQRQTEGRPSAPDRAATEDFSRLVRNYRLRVEGVVDAPVRLIETGFTMDVGETVVVGTSRVGGDKALIVLLTAAPRSGRR